MITSIDPPLSGTDAGGMQILIHWLWLQGHVLWFGWVDGEGRVLTGPHEDIKVDFRFTKDGRWLSVGPADLKTMVDEA